MWLAAALLLWSLLAWLVRDALRPHGFPPGPRWWPLLGCAPQLFRLRARCGYLYEAVNELARLHSADHVLGLRIGKDRIVMVNSLEANREMLHNEDLDGRPSGIFYQTRTWGERRGVLLTDGELWKEQRRFLLTHLKEFGFGRRGMEDIARAEARHMVHDLAALVQEDTDSPAAIQMHNFFNTYVLNTLWSMMAGLRYAPSDPQMQTLQTLLFELFAAVDMVGATFSHFPILRYLAPGRAGYNDFVKTHERIWKFLRDEIDKHKERFDPKVEDKDFMDAYIRVLREKGEVDTYSEGQLVAMCMDMFMAGTETTSKSLSFCFSYLVREQHIQKKVQEEIDRVLGTRFPCLQDRANMPYTEAVVLEAVRHFMGRTFGVPHRALRDTHLAGARIAQGSMVLSNYTRVLMDARLFPRPRAFLPERFVRAPPPPHFFPFGLARRRCIGDALARCNMFLFVAALLQRFSFEPLPGEPLPSVRHVDGATPSAAPFRARVVPRAPGAQPQRGGAAADSARMSSHV